jgi:glycosyltransferase involved in cell wall biosynthesis
VRACFLLKDLAPSGGVKVVLDHARRLPEAGVAAEVLLTGAPAPPDPPDGVRVRPLNEAREERYDIALATWWETARELLDVSAGTRAIFLQNLEERYYREDEAWDRLGASVALAAPVHFVVVAWWMEELLGRLRPDAEVRHVQNGIDKSVFTGGAGERGDGPLRVLVEGQPSVWWKGVQDAVDAVRAMSEPVHLTIAAQDPSGAERLDADRVTGGLDAAGMAALYAETDVLVKLARFEGFGLAPIEAFHLGVPCVVTPYTGHEDYVVHGENGLVVGFDDRLGVAGWLDRLAWDRRLLEHLGAGAARTAARWPSPEDSTRLLCDALRQLADAPGPDPAAAVARVLDEIRAAAELNRERARGEGGAALAEARALIEELSHSREECRRELERVVSTRAYRAATSARRVLDLVRR